VQFRANLSAFQDTVSVRHNQTHCGQRQMARSSAFEGDMRKHKMLPTSMTGTKLTVNGRPCVLCHSQSGCCQHSRPLATRGMAISQTASTADNAKKHGMSPCMGCER